MEEHLSPLAVTHLLQHTLRSLCIHENSEWVYAVFWRILPRNYPPPKWEGQGAYDRSRGNRRNWILVWEDGFCNFAASSAPEMNSPGDCPASSSAYGNCEFQHYQGLQPELFFKMSHEIYNYGEGLIGKVAADHSHKWIYKEPNDQEINFLSAWHNSADSHPRTWEAQFQSGIKTIALIAVREGVVQLGAVHKVIEDLSHVVLLRKKFSYIESIPGVLLPHPSSSAAAYPSPSSIYNYKMMEGLVSLPPDQWQYFHSGAAALAAAQPPPPPPELYDHFNNNNQPLKITPSMSSLEALLSKLPSVVPPVLPSDNSDHHNFVSSFEFMGMQKTAKQENIEDDDDDHDDQEVDVYRPELDVGESSSSMPPAGYRHHHQPFHDHNNLTNNSGRPNNNGF